MMEDRSRMGEGTVDVCVAEEVMGSGAAGLGDKSQILIIGNKDVVSSYKVKRSQRSHRYATRRNTDPDGENQSSPLPFPTNNMRNPSLRPRFRTPLALLASDNLLCIFSKRSPASRYLSVLSKDMYGSFLIRDENKVYRRGRMNERYFG